MAQRKALKTLAFVNGQEKTPTLQASGFQVFGGEGVRQFERKINALQPSSTDLFHQKPFYASPLNGHRAFIKKNYRKR
jgi:hypothetical protein